MNWDQFRAILWLRWRLTRNQFARAGQLNAVLSIIFLCVFLVAGVGLGLTGVLVGAFGASKAPPQVLLVIWDGVLLAFLVIWLSGLMIEIQRSESIDLTKLLHLPVTLRQVFLLNYAASHFTPSLALFLPGMLGLCAGLTLSAGLGMALLGLVVLGFLFMLTAWTYCLRGWLAALMINKRRRRAIIVWVTIIFVLIFQLPNFLVHSNMFRGPKRSHAQARRGQTPPTQNRPAALALPEGFVEAHLAIPPGWVGYSAMALKEHNPWPGLGVVTASTFLGVLGLMRAYRVTIRFYQGAESSAGTAPRLPRQASPSSRLLVEWRLPWLPDDTAALALATFRSLLRAPELKMAFIMPLVMAVLLFSAQFSGAKHPPSPLAAGLMATGAALLASFSLAPVMANIFGLDRNGFRALILLPTPRHQILLAKNLAFFPFVLAIAVVLLALLALLVRLSSAAVLAGVFKAPLAFVMFSLTGNLVSILAPYRLAPGTLQAKKPKPIVFLAFFLSFLALPFVVLPLAIPTGVQLLFSTLGWAPWLPVNLLATLALLALFIWLYGLLLPLEGRLLQRREQAILKEVTEEVE